MLERSKNHRMFYIQMTDEEWAELKEAFKKKGIPMSQFVTEALKQKKKELDGGK